MKISNAYFIFLTRMSRDSTIFLLFLGSVAIYGLYQHAWNNRIEKNGAYLKGKVIKSESTRGSVLITVEYIFHAKRYESMFGSDLGKKAVGRYYFIQLDPYNPEAIIFHKDKPVPDCLLYVDAPPEGWKEIPTCP